MAPTIVAAVVGLVVTLVVILVPGVRFAYRSISAHLAMENVDASIAALVAVLFYGRFRRTVAAGDALVSGAFFLLAACGYMLVALPAAEAGRDVVWTSWVPLVVRLLAAGLIALAAANPQRLVTDRRDVRRAAAVIAVVLAAVITAGVVTGDRLPAPLDPTVSPEASGRPVFVGAAPVLAAQAVHGFLYAFAAVAFARHARHVRDDLTQWLAAGCAFGAFARVNYLLFPSLYSQWLYTGDFLRTAFYIVLGIGAVRELLTYWRVQAEHAVFSERRRLARDLHDGTVQELGYIRALARQMQRGGGDPTTADRILSASERALAEARQAIAALSQPLDEPLGDVVRRAVGEIGDRHDVQVSVETADLAPVDRTLQDAIVRIVREAVSNAARHAQARRIDVQVGNGYLEVSDDGRGFDPHVPVNGGFGLVSMNDRAEAVGGHLRVTSRRGSGTTVRMVWDDGGR